MFIMFTQKCFVWGVLWFFVQPICLQIKIDYSQFFPLLVAINHGASVATDPLNKI